MIQRNDPTLTIIYLVKAHSRKQVMESLKLPATLESLKAIREFIGSAASKAGLTRDRSYGLTLAVDEIATNIITHGYEEAGGTGDILINANVTDGVVEITLEDTGVPFNPLLHAEPRELDAPLEERGVGGLGIFLARKSVDEFRYHFMDGRNHNIFVIRLEHSANLPKG
jgi:anti-sigma regulatory factor (Ser/Thr protein kinase)